MQALQCKSWLNTWNPPSQSGSWKFHEATILFWWITSLQHIIYYKLKCFPRPSNKPISPSLSVNSTVGRRDDDTVAKFCSFTVSWNRTFHSIKLPTSFSWTRCGPIASKVNLSEIHAFNQKKSALIASQRSNKLVSVVLFLFWWWFGSSSFFSTFRCCPFLALSTLAGNGLFSCKWAHALTHVIGIRVLGDLTCMPREIE